MIRKKKNTNIVEAGEQTKEGHNVVGASFSKDRFKKYVKKIELLEKDRKNVSDDIKSVYYEAKQSGLSVRCMRRVIMDRRSDKDSVAEFEDTVRIYKEALGDFSNTPLGQAAKDDEE